VAAAPAQTAGYNACGGSEGSYAGGGVAGQGAPVLARRRLVKSDIGPVELATVYLPLHLAAGTDLAEARPIEEGFVKHLADRTGGAAG
jgi:hypothetical protein